MTSTEAEAAAAAAAMNTRAEKRRLYHIAGLGGVGAFVAWAAQPVIVSIMSPRAPQNGPDFAYIESAPFLGVMEAIVFSAIGVAILFLVTAVGQLMLVAGPLSTATRVGQLLGIISGIAWFFVAGSSFALYTSVGFHLGELAPQQGLQQALYQLHAVGLIGFIGLYMLGVIGWLVMLATVGRRTGVIGWPLAIVCILAVGIMVTASFVPFAPPWGSLAGVGAAFVLGVVFLVKARRAG
ncbi:MAG: hypothetical protein ABWY57_14790 [Mycetocola sp.]